MAYDPGQIEATLAAAAGDDAGLVAELRIAFAESADKAWASLAAARNEVEWRSAAARLRGLAGSFGAIRLMALAAEASDADTGDRGMLKRLRRAIDRL